MYTNSCKMKKGYIFHQSNKNASQLFSLHLIVALFFLRKSFRYYEIHKSGNGVPQIFCGSCQTLLSTYSTIKRGIQIQHFRKTRHDFLTIFKEMSRHHSKVEG